MAEDSLSLAATMQPLARTSLRSQPPCEVGMMLTQPPGVTVRGMTGWHPTPALCSEASPQAGRAAPCPCCEVL